MLSNAAKICRYFLWNDYYYRFKKTSQQNFFLFRWNFTRAKLHDFTSNNNNFYYAYMEKHRIFCAILDLSIGNGRRSLDVEKRWIYVFIRCVHSTWMCMVLVIVYKWWIVWIDIVDFRFDFGWIPTIYVPNLRDLLILFHHPARLVIHLLWYSHAAWTDWRHELAYSLASLPLEMVWQRLVLLPHTMVAQQSVLLWI